MLGGKSPRAKTFFNQLNAPDLLSLIWDIVIVQKVEIAARYALFKTDNASNNDDFWESMHDADKQILEHMLQSSDQSRQLGVIKMDARRFLEGSGKDILKSLYLKANGVRQRHPL